MTQPRRPLLGLWAAWQLRRVPALAIVDRVRLGLCGFVATAATVAVLWLIVPADITPDNGDVTSQSMRTIERVFPWGVPSRILSFVRERARTKAQLALSMGFRFNATVPAALVYVSDHGELLIEAGCDKRWHGHGAREDVFASALVWLSKHPENAPKTRAAAFNATLAVSGKDLFDSLLDAGGILVPGNPNQASWFNPDYRPRPRSVVTCNGVVSADLPPVGACLMLTKP